MATKKTKMAKEPQVGDPYWPLMHSDYQYTRKLHGEQLTIVEVEPHGDNPNCCAVVATDEAGNQCGYDCMWSMILQAWVYNSEGER